VLSCLDWIAIDGNFFFPIYTGLFKMIVGVLTTCHTNYT